MAKTKKAKSSTKAEGKQSSSVEAEINRIQAMYGKGCISTGNSAVLNISKIPTEILGLDNIIGGGFPEGRIVEIYGPESSGKTTLMLTLAAAYQSRGKTVAFIDAEHALDPVYAHNLGVNVNEMMISQPDNGEQALNIAQALTEGGVVDLIIVDSVSALTPKSEIDGEVGDSHMGLQARMMGQSLRKITGVAEKNKVTVCFINQLRQKIGVMFGNPETTSGGNALKFYASLRMDIRRIATIKDGEESIGNRVRIKTVKNKVAPPFRQGEFTILFGKGFDKLDDLFTLADKYKIVQKAGAWISYGDLKVQGAPKFLAALSEDQKLLNEIREKVLDAMTPKMEDAAEDEVKDQESQESQPEEVPA